MLFYGIVILIAYLLVAGLNIAFGNFGLPFWYSPLFTLGYAAIAVLIDGLVAGILRWFIPERKMEKMNSPLFELSRKKEVFYVTKLKIRKWKDHIPELGGFTSFSKAKMERPDDNTYIARFMLESKYGILIHYFSFPASFLIVFFDWHMFVPGCNVFYGLSIGLPVALVNAVLIVLPALVLRYNLKKLRIIYEFNASKNA